jgi:hypothetical protein
MPVSDQMRLEHKAGTIHHVSEPLRASLVHVAISDFEILGEWAKPRPFGPVAVKPAPRFCVMMAASGFTQIHPKVRASRPIETFQDHIERPVEIGERVT